MSKEYDAYLKEHISNVKKGYNWLAKHYGKDYDLNSIFVMHHDSSKNTLDEYEPYDRYFYGKDKSQKTLDEFNKAWLHHIHNNPHHWQYWVLLMDDPEDTDYICIEMPIEYVFEMIADWWSFSWKKGNLNEIFDWYNKHKNTIKLNSKTRKIVEDIIDRMRNDINK